MEKGIAKAANENQLTATTAPAEVGEAEKGSYEQSKTEEHSASRDGSQVEAQRLPPLLNSDILDHLFPFLIPNWIQSAPVLNELLNLRLVCWCWNDAAIRLWKRNRKSALEFRSSSSGRNADSENRMERFLDTMETSWMIPVQKYKFRQEGRFASPALNRFHRLLRICGSDVVSLGCVLIMRIERIPEWAEEENDVLPDLELGKLKKFVFKYCNYETDSEGKTILPHNSVVACFGALLRGATALKEFKITLTDCDEHFPIPATLPLFQVMFQNMPKSLKVMKLDLCLVELALLHFNVNGIELRELSCNVKDEDESASEPFTKFLESQAATLEVLQVTHHYRKPMFFSIRFPIMWRIKRLAVQRLTVTPFAFHDTFPSLERLDMSGGWEDEEALAKILSFGKKKPARTVKVLHLLAHPHLFRDVSICFPNVVKLVLGPCLWSVETLENAFQHFRNIEELFIGLNLMMPYVKLNLDSVFSGVHKKKVAEIRARGTFPKENLEDFRSQPSILNMARLKRLIFFDCDSCPVHNGDFHQAFSDFGAHFILLRMPKLRELALLQYEHQISPQYIEQLKQRAKLTLPVAIRGDGPWLDSYDYPFSYKDFQL